MPDFEATVLINNEYVDLAAPIALTINRGIEPSLVDIIIRDDREGVTRFDEMENPVKISIITPDSTHQLTLLELENWYITHMVPHSPGFWQMTLQDIRWKANHTRVTVGYNIYVAGYGTDPVARETSLNGGAPWKCYDAAKDAIERFGFEFEEEEGFPRELKDVELPRNLGNSLAGGFVQATFDSVLPKLLNPIHCDPVVLPNGKIKITDRSWKQSANLEQYMATAGVALPRKMIWSKPKKIFIRAEQRVARYFEGDETATSATDEDIQVEMVIPKEIENFFDGIVDAGHVNLLDAVQDEWAITAKELRARWLKPLVIPQDTQNDNVELLEKKDKWESWIRESYRQRWRIMDAVENTSLVNVQIGHLGKNGNTRSERSVYMRFAFIKAYSEIYQNHDYDDVENLVISRNVDIDYRRPAPWLAVFFIDSRGELIFQLIPQLQWATYARELIIGETVGPIRTGDYYDLTQDGFVIEAASQTKLKSNWFCRVYYHGLLVEDRPDLGLERLHTEERVMFADGKIDSIEYFINDLTANWGYETPDDLENDNLSLLNEDEINERADYVAEQVKRNFADGNAGVMQTAGLDAIVNGKYWTGGDIHSLQIQIGAKKPYSVECLWTVMPEVRPVYVNRLKLSGEPVGRIG